MPSRSSLVAFHQDPRRLACAQAVLHLWHEQQGEDAYTAAALDPLARTEAGPGTCGVLLAARALAPEDFAELEGEFRQRFGDCRCRDLCDPEVHPCRDRVAYICAALARGAPAA